jgi:hypothetical protein
LLQAMIIILQGLASVLASPYDSASGAAKCPQSDTGPYILHAASSAAVQYHNAQVVIGQEALLLAQHSGLLRMGSSDVTPPDSEQHSYDGIAVNGNTNFVVPTAAAAADPSFQMLEPHVLQASAAVGTAATAAVAAAAAAANTGPLTSSRQPLGAKDTNRSYDSSKPTCKLPKTCSSMSAGACNNMPAITNSRNPSCKENAFSSKLTNKRSRLGRPALQFPATSDVAAAAAAAAVSPAGCPITPAGRINAVESFHHVQPAADSNDTVCNGGKDSSSKAKGSRSSVPALLSNPPMPAMLPVISTSASPLGAPSFSNGLFNIGPLYPHGTKFGKATQHSKLGQAAAAAGTVNSSSTDGTATAAAHPALNAHHDRAALLHQLMANSSNDVGKGAGSTGGHKGSVIGSKGKGASTFCDRAIGSNGSSSLVQRTAEAAAAATGNERGPTFKNDKQRQQQQQQQGKQKHYRHQSAAGLTQKNPDASRSASRS